MVEFRPLASTLFTGRWEELREGGGPYHGGGFLPNPGGVACDGGDN